MVIIFQCQPVKEAWDPLRAYKQECIAIGDLSLAGGIVEVILDVAIICLPIGTIKQLHLPKRKKWSVMAIFMLGGL